MMMRYVCVCVVFCRLNSFHQWLRGEPLTSVITVWRGSDTGEPVSGTMLTPAPAWGRANMGSFYQFTAQTHTWHTWQRRLSQSADAIGVWVPLEPRQDWRGVFHRQLEGEKREEWRRGETCREKESMGSVTGHTKTSRQCVSERGEWRREVIEMLG